MTAPRTWRERDLFEGEDMRDEKIRVGIIGAGGWAKYGHIPALQSLEEFEIVAVSSRKKELAEEYAVKFNILHAFAAIMPGRYEWTFDASNFTHVLAIYAGHFLDMLFQSVGFPKKLTAVVENQFPLITIEETGQKIPTTRPDEAMVIGTLEDGGL